MSLARAVQTERLWIGMVNCEILINGTDEIRLGVKNTAPDSVGGQIAEKMFHPIQLGCTGGREMELETLISLLPRLDFGVLGRGIVVADDMDLLSPRNSLLHLFQIMPTVESLIPIPWREWKEPGARA